MWASVFKAHGHNFSLRRKHFWISLLMPGVFFCPPGGIMSSFLMGCYDPDSKKWCTVTKCSGGYDDATLARLQKELDVIKISKVRKDPLMRRVWENSTGKVQLDMY